MSGTMSGGAQMMPSGAKESRVNSIKITDVQRIIADQYAAPLIKLNDLKKIIEFSLQIPHRSFQVIGLAGVGKTDVFKQVAAKLGIGLELFLLGEMNEGDLQGLPFPDNETCTVKRFPFSRLPTVEAVKAGRFPASGIVLLDELSRASGEVLNGALQLLGAHACGDSVIDSNWVIWCANNPDIGQYNVTKMDPAFLNRLATFAVQLDANKWLEWGKETGRINRLVRDFIDTHSDDLYDIVAHNSKKVFASPRSWERVSEIIDIVAQTHLKTTGKTEVFFTDIASDIEDVGAMIAGNVGTPVSKAFFSFLTTYIDKITGEDIVYHYTQSTEANNTLEPWYGARTDVNGFASRGLMGLVNMVMDRAINVIHRDYPPLYKDGGSSIKNLSPEFFNIYMFWEDIATISQDKAMQFYQALVEIPMGFTDADKKAKLRWLNDFESAYNKYVDKVANKTPNAGDHFSKSIQEAFVKSREMKQSGIIN